MSETVPEAGPVHLDDYAPIVGREEVADLRALASRLGGRTVRIDQLDGRGWRRG